MAARALRLAAFSLDTLLAILVAVAVRLLVRMGYLPDWGSWSVYAAGSHIDVQLVGLSLILLAARDVLWGSSPAKWLLGLRLVRPDGTRLSLLQRLLRAPFSLLPLGVMRRSVQDALPWRVVSYVPGRMGVLTRTAATAFAATFSLLWAVETIRPSISRRHAEELSEDLAAGDLLLRRQLGTPLTVEIGTITRRAHQFERGRMATFQLNIHGPLGRQEMTVVARKVDGDWRLSELRDIAILLGDDAERVAERAGGSGAVAPE
jgi:uncharacterized RDD family membrane protein YckC